MPPRRATEPIAASLILNINIREPSSPADKISRKFGPRSGATMWLKLITIWSYSRLLSYTLEATCANKGANGLRGCAGWSLPLTKSGFSRVYRRLANKVYAGFFFKYIATLRCYNHKFRHALSSIRSFHAYMSS